MKKVFCDRCGKEIKICSTPNGHYLIKTLNEGVLCEVKNPTKNKKTLTLIDIEDDICIDCIIEILISLTNRLE